MLTFPLNKSDKNGGKQLFDVVSECRNYMEILVSSTVILKLIMVNIKLVTRFEPLNIIILFMFKPFSSQI